MGESEGAPLGRGDRQSDFVASTSTEVQGWADQHQYLAEPMQAQRDDLGNVIPTVKLLWMTPDPLGAIAAMCRMYEGVPTYDLADIDDEQRKHYFAQSQATHLKAPLEAVKMHFFIEGVTRSFTHQMVRQRTAVYAQESMRFAVKDNLAEEVSLPPSLAVLPRKSDMRQRWDDHMRRTEEFYNYMVNGGIPAEDARGIMPHAVTTRLNYVTDLRNLSDHAGNRLCTQAQFEWRVVFLAIVQAIRTHVPDMTGMTEYGARDEGFFILNRGWQFQEIANSTLFRPVCYQLNRCPFQASFDRSCTIRGRVETFADMGIKSERWGDQDFLDHCGEEAIDPKEWMLDPAAARMTSRGGGH